MARRTRPSLTQRRSHPYEPWLGLLLFVPRVVLDRLAQRRQSEYRRDRPVDEMPVRALGQLQKWLLQRLVLAGADLAARPLTMTADSARPAEHLSAHQSPWRLIGPNHEHKGRVSEESPGGRYAALASGDIRFLDRADQPNALFSQITTTLPCDHRQRAGVGTRVQFGRSQDPLIAGCALRSDGHT
jgi:hypothetical protein